VESSVLGEHGEQMAVETTKAFKKIKVKTLTAKSDLQQLAEEVTDKCKLIHSSKVGQVHTLLKRLQDRETRQASGGYQGACSLKIFVEWRLDGVEVVAAGRGLGYSTSERVRELL
jgi:hypothetical protein